MTETASTAPVHLVTQAGLDVMGMAGSALILTHVSLDAISGALSEIEPGDTEALARARRLIEGLSEKTHEHGLMLTTLVEQIEEGR